MMINFVNNRVLRVARLIIISTVLFFCVPYQAYCSLVLSKQAQEIRILHKVQKGETISSICRQYKMEQKDLVRLNPELIFGLKEGAQINVLPIQKQVQETTVKISKDDVFAESVDFYYYLIKSGETVYSISKKLDVPIPVVYQYNPESEKEVLENEIIRIPKVLRIEDKGGLVREDDEYYYHRVAKGQGAYTIAQKYGISLGDLYEANSELGQNFDQGEVVKVPKEPLEKEMVKIIDANIPFFMHRVEMGDYYYAYKRRYGVSEQELKNLNPVLNEIGLLAGIEIKMPVKEELRKKLQPKETNIDSSLYIVHKALPKETLWSLAQGHGVKVRDIKSLNPALQHRGLFAGETILIKEIKKEVELPALVTEKIFEPEEKDEEVAVTELLGIDTLSNPFIDSLKLIPVAKEYIQRDDTIDIAILLPFYFEANDTLNKKLVVVDSLIDSLAIEMSVIEEVDIASILTDSLQADSMLAESDSFRSIETRSLYSRSRNFTYFYEGFLLAVDSLQKAGINIRTHVYDTKNDTLVVDSLVRFGYLDSLDLIIGPVYDRNQKAVNELSMRLGVPLVSPLSANETFTRYNPFYFQVAPTKDYVIRKTADFIGDEFYNKNFIMLSMGNYKHLDEAKMVDLVRDKFYTTGYYDEANEVLFRELDFEKEKYWGLKRILNPKRENVIFVPDSREAKIHIAVSNLVTLSEKYPITLVGMNNFERFRSIGVEYYHQLNLYYMTPYHIDYTAYNVNQFVHQFRNDFYSEPNRYSFQGYDIGMYFISALNELGNDFLTEVENYTTNLTQANYHFRKVNETGGYMNHSLFLRNYTHEFDIEVIDSVTEGMVAK